MENITLPESISSPLLAEEILGMVKVDQEMRLKAQRDKNYWNDKVDKKNTARIKQIIHEIGWPTISRVGEEASYGAWLLVQHADHDLEFQKYCLKLIKEIEKQNPEEIELSQIAFLEDRVMVSEYGKQRFGTQFCTQKDGSLAPVLIEDEEHVDERRKQYGMESLREYMLYMNRL